jgi:hypothetical protein
MHDVGLLDPQRGKGQALGPKAIQESVIGSLVEARECPPQRLEVAALETAPVDATG